ncbi:MAG: M23 family metallopeptidase, partial [Chloroflexota bacterium]
TGDFVGQGSIIAWSGSTGNSTGPHVHYETRLNDIPLDPLSFSSRGYPSC